MSNKFISTLALVALFFTVQGCVSSYRSTSSTPYGQSSARQVCAFGNCFTMQDQAIQATVNTPGYAACIEAFTADNERATACSGDAAGCRTVQYSQVQIMDACTLRAAYLNGGMGMGMGFMNWGAGAFGGPGMMGTGYGAPMTMGPGAYAGGTYDPRNAVSIATYDAQRQQALAAPRIPNTGSAADQARDEEILRQAEFRVAYCRENPSSSACSSH